MSHPLKLIKAALLAELRRHVILKSYRGNRLVGRRCDLCNTRWKGLKEKHKPTCLILEAV